MPVPLSRPAALVLLSAASFATAFTVMGPSAGSCQRVACRPAGASVRKKRGPIWTSAATGVAGKERRQKPLFKLEKLLAERYSHFPKTDMETEKGRPLAPTVDLAQSRHAGGGALRRLYHASDRIVIVKYYKEKCSMCRVLQPLMDKVVRGFEDRVHFVAVEVVSNKEVIQQAGLLGVPTCHMFYRGMLVAHFSGLLSRKAMGELIANTLDLYASMSDAKVEELWAARKEAADEEDLRKAEEEMVHRILYPIKGIMAPGRVLVPVHWNHLFERGGHSVGIADRLGPRDPLIPGRFLDQFLDNNNCMPDATSGTAFMRALQKSDVVSTRGKLLAPTHVQGEPRVLVGRITDGESNLHFLPLSTGGGQGRGVDRGREVRSVEVCDETGCAMIYE